MLNFDKLKKVVNTETGYEDFYNDNNELAASRKLSENGDVENEIIYYKNGKKAEMLPDTVYNRQYWSYSNKEGRIVIKKTIGKNGKLESKVKLRKDNSYSVEYFKEGKHFDYNRYIYYFDKNNILYKQAYFWDNKLIRINIIVDERIFLTINNLQFSRAENLRYLKIAESCLQNVLKQRKIEHKEEINARCN